MCMLTCFAKGKNTKWNTPSTLAVNEKSFSVKAVEFSDTATIISFDVDNPRYDIWLTSKCFLVGDDGKHYPIRWCKEYPLDCSIPIKEKQTTLTFGFAPMTDKSKAIDLIQGYSREAIRVWGIHNGDKELKIPKFQVNEAEISDFRENFLKTDTAYVTGRIEDYTISSGLTSFNIGYQNNLTATMKTIVIPVREDGTFERKILLDYPAYCRLQSDNNGIETMALILPGKSLDITVHKDGSADFATHSGETPDGLALMKYNASNLDLTPGDYVENLNKYDFVDFCNLTEQAQDKNLRLIDYMAYRYKYTSLDYHLAATEAKVKYCGNLLDYASEKYFGRYDGNEIEPNILDQMFDKNNYRLLKQLPYNDFTMLCTDNYWLLQNRFPCPIFRKDKNDFLYSGILDDSITIAKDKEFFGQDKQSVLAKIDILNHIKEQEKFIYNEGTVFNHIIDKSYAYLNDGINVPVFPREDGTYPTDKELIENSRTDYINAFAKRYELLDDETLQAYAKKMKAEALAQKNVIVPLPECEATTLLRAITDRYKGKYVFLDFWSTSCGPCRASIERSEKMRNECRNMSDVVFVYITNENESPEKAYNSYVAKHLANDHTYRVSNAEYKKYMELFKFLGIPHYEALDKKGNLIRGLEAPDETESFKKLIERLNEKEE